MNFDYRSCQMKQPLIHIGYPKAVSSWMQKHLFLPQNGFLTVLNPLETQISVIDPTPFCYNTAQALEFIQQNIAKKGMCEELVPVITAESLIGNMYCGGFNARQNSDRLYELCPDAKILIVIREQKSFIRSLYKTLITWGMPHSIKRLLNPDDTSMAPQFNWDFLRFDLVVSHYQQLFGKNNVLVLPYELFGKDPKEFLETLFEFSGISTSGEKIAKLPVKKKVNKGQTLLNIILQRLHNRFFLSSPFNYSGWFRSTENRIHKRIRRSKRNPFPRFLDSFLESRFARIVMAESRGKFAQSNRRLQELTGLNLSEYGYELD